MQREKMEHNEPCKDLEMENRTNGIHHYQITKPLTDCDCGCHSSGHFLYYETEFAELVKLRKKFESLVLDPNFDHTPESSQYRAIVKQYEEMRSKFLQESKFTVQEYEKRLYLALQLIESETHLTKN